MAINAAMGQQPFLFTHAELGYDVVVSDVDLSNDRAIVVASIGDSVFLSPYRGMVFKTTGSGEVEIQRMLASTAYNFITPNVLLHSSDDRLHVLGAYTFAENLNSGYFHYGLSTEGSILDSSFTEIPSAKKVAVENAILTSQDQIAFTVSLAFQADYLAYSHAQIVETDLNGGHPAAFTIGTSNSGNMQITRDLAELGGNLLFSVEKWPGSPALYGFANAQTATGRYWLGQSPHFDPLNPTDSILKGAMSLLPLDAHRFFVGGSFLIGSPRYNSAVYLMDTTGAVLSTFIPHSPYQHDISATMNCIAAIDDVSFYFVAIENVGFLGGHIPFTPDQPNRVHIYKLDTGLNVLCDHILDGFATNVAYVPTRIRTTPDGGYVLMGGMKDISTPGNNLVGWAQHFSATSCSTGISALAARHHVTVFPNPGTVGFEVLLNGGGLPGGMITLFDSKGITVGESFLNGNTGRVDCRTLPTGLYLYRITDHTGKPYTSGSWSKQE